MDALNSGRERERNKRIMFQFCAEVTDISTKAYKMLIAVLLDQTSTAGYHNE
jgi:hypothetical protein